MRRIDNPIRTSSLALGSAMALSLLAGCAGQSSFADNGRPVSNRLADVDGDAVVAKAERRVERSPESASARTELAQAYLLSGRFDSAATTFEDAVALGGDNARTGLGLALAYIGAGRNAEAFAVLGRWREEMPQADFGLAIALAGRPALGVAVLTEAVRGGDNDAKTRQNLAYAYALDGKWAQARLIASQDVPADQLEARLQEWARKARPAASRERVAGLLGTPVRADPGQPAALALGGPKTETRLARADIPAPTFGQAAADELDPVEADEPSASTEPLPVAAPTAEAETVAPISLALAADEPASASSSKFVSSPVIQEIAKSESIFQASVDKMTTQKIVPAEKASPPRSPHLVQLGSFSTRAAAERAWGVFVGRNPALKNHSMRITEADVLGRRYYRVAAEGFDATSARSMCASVKRSGGGCLAYSELRPLPGARRSGAGATLRAR